ncbi:hypothetical protein [Rhodococcus sp. NBC_00297]|uniref:hypothetical protein n=1 Tax=Rhodococcus sp. NBC_00297 TaxID=2976005 RepID=UPI002E2D7407|nr:hypothetical protein [Rhodococcus sp. NBC_00297]
MAVHVVDDRVEVRCPEVHPDARMSFSFQRTLRVPDDGTTYDLPPGLGRLQVTESGQDDDGVTRFAMPMWQSEACWINFDAGYPFLVTMSSGTVNVLTGEPWSPVPDFEAEDYLEVPDQRWLDGFTVEKGTVRQFVAAPLGADYTVEEQLSSEPARGGIQVAVYPLLASKYSELDHLPTIICFSAPPNDAMGLGAGGSIRQAVATPVVPHDSWDLEHGRRFTVDIVNSAVWQQLTGSEPASVPLSAAEYTRFGMPWFALYDELVVAREGSSTLGKVQTIADVDAGADEPILPENESFEKPVPVLVIG